ncbi:MAG: RNA polymerase sigma factor [Phycisphaerae bacterium]
MPDTPDNALFDAVRTGDESAFAQVYDRYHQRARLLAWRVSHRSDWIDDLLGESWCRAFRLRASFDTSRPFLVWFGGILRNVYREHCRHSPTTLGGVSDDPAGISARIDGIDPEKIAAEAELLAALDDCVGGLDAGEARLVRLRFFDGLTLRVVAKEVKIPESTLREHRLPAVFDKLRRCLSRKGIDFSQLSPAQLSAVLQYTVEEAE